MKRVISHLFLIVLMVAGLLFAGCMKNEKNLTPDNQAPMINYFDLFPQTVIRYNTVTITVKYKDYDNDPVKFTIIPYDTNPDVGILTQDKNNSNVFYWFAPKTAGRYWFKAIGDDGHFKTESIFSIIVLSRPPDLALDSTTKYDSSDPNYDHMKITTTSVTTDDLDYSVSDKDEPPTTTIQASISMEQIGGDSNDGTIILNHSTLNFKSTFDTDLISIAGGESTNATITLDTISRTVKLRGELNVDTAAASLINSDFNNPAIFEVMVRLVDESGNVSTNTRKIKIFK